MLRAVFFLCALSSSAILISSPVSSEPIPAVKPLQSTDRPAFIEGVDTPPQKPATAVPLAPRKVPKKIDSADCQIEGLIFKHLPPVDGTLDGDAACGIVDPIVVSGVNGGKETASFRMPVTVSCEFAQVLSGWLLKDVLPEARKRLGMEVRRLGSGPGYQCRRRNNKPDGKLSEHALGKAIDFSGFQLTDGSLISIEKDWGAETPEGEFLKAIHKSACERFTTVLGPEADPNHKSHFHLDIGCHGKDCTYLICQ
ncbi:MAG: extensin family protein [Pseudomonadota bacterium]